MKQDPVQAIYALYDEVTAPFGVQCRKGCAHCCTCNVTLTGLEARYLLDRLDTTAQARVMERIRSLFPENRYQPSLTVNGLAQACRQGRSVPDESNDPGWGRCPLLEADVCTVYAGRPLGCRTLISTVDCGVEGTAEIPSFVLTVNNVFMQYLEHLDAGGVFGNLSDVLPHVCSERAGGSGGLPSSLVRNQPLPVWMVPQAHRGQIRSVLAALSRIRRS